MQRQRLGHPAQFVIAATIVATILITLASCGAKPSIFASLVPADAFLVGYAQNPEVLFENADDFIKSVGMEALLGGSKTQDLALGQVGAFGVDPDEVKPLIDLSRPSGFYAVGSDFKTMKPVILIAVKNESKARAWITENLGEGMLALSAKGYVALSPLGGDFSWPPAESLSGDVFKERGKDRVVVAVDYARLMKDPIMAQAMAEAYSEAPALATLTTDMLASMGWLSVQLGLDGKVLTLGTTMAFDPSTDYGKLIKAVKYGKASMIGDLSTEEVMGWAANAELADLPAYMAYLGALSSILKIDLSSIEEPLKKLTKASGADGFFSLDFDPDPDLAHLDGVEVVQGLGLSMKGKAAVKDRASFRAALEELLSAISGLATEGIKAAIAASEGEDALASAPAFAVAFETRKDQKGKASTWDSHALRLDLEGLEEEEAQMLAAFNEMLEFKVSYGKDMAFIAAGEDSETALDSLASGTKPKAPLSAASGYAEVAAALGTKPSMLFHLSLARIINKVAPLSGVDMKVDEAVPGLLMGAGLDGDLYYMDLALSAPELKSYIGQAFPLIMQMFTGRKSMNYDDGYGSYGLEEGNEGFDYDALDEYEGDYGEGYVVPEYPDDEAYGD